MASRQQNQGQAPGPGMPLQNGNNGNPSPRNRLNGNNFPDPPAGFNGPNGTRPQFNNMPGNNATRPGGRPGGGFMNTGNPGALRLFISPLSKETSWLLPFGLVTIILLAAGSRWQWPLALKHQALVLWGGWLITCAIFFSIAGFFHEYYLSMMGAPLAHWLDRNQPDMESDRTTSLACDQHTRHLCNRHSRISSLYSNELPTKYMVAFDRSESPHHWTDGTGNSGDQPEAALHICDRIYAALRGDVPYPRALVCLHQLERQSKPVVAECLPAEISTGRAA
jgi:4-amino-4-deoxy-L-arabinose transferase-like glycosyltransferase